MQFNLKSPCKDCPYRTDKEPFITQGRAEELARALLGDGFFYCHKYVDYDLVEESEPLDDIDAEEQMEGEFYAGTESDQMCAGSMIMLEHMGQANQMMRIAERLGMYDHTQMDMEAPVFKSSDEFIKHHARTRRKA